MCANFKPEGLPVHKLMSLTEAQTVRVCACVLQSGQRVRVLQIVRMCACVLHSSWCSSGARQSLGTLLSFALNSMQSLGQWGGGGRAGMEEGV